MVRPYAVKGKKRKEWVEKYDKEEQEQEEEKEEEEEEKANEQPLEAVERNKTSNGDEEDNAQKGVDVELEGIPLAPSDQKDVNKSGVVFILEKASLEVAKVGKTYQLLNSDDHANFLRKNNRNPADYRPDIVHQSLLNLLDSALNKAGRVRAVYVRTDRGILIEINPHVRIPRTFRRFAGVMLQLLQKLTITAVSTREKLMRVVKNPVTQYLPASSHKIGLSYTSEKLVKLRDYVTPFASDMNLVFVVGAMAHGKIETDYTEDYIAISGYPLSAALCIVKICEALENKWDIL